MRQLCSFPLSSQFNNAPFPKAISWHYEDINYFCKTLF